MAIQALLAASTLAAYMVTRSYPGHLLDIYGALSCLWMLYLVFRISIYPFYFSPFRHLPEPYDKASFPWAHAKYLDREHNSAPMRRWTNSVPNDGMIRFRVLFNQERLLLTSPEALREVLVTKSYEFVKPEQATFLFRKALGNGLLVAEGDAHRSQRKSLLPAFAFRHVKDLYPMFWDKARQSTDEISKASRSTVGSAEQLTPQLAYEWASRTTLDIIGQSGIGHDFNSISDAQGLADDGLVSTYRKLFDSEPPQFRWLSLGYVLPLKTLFYMPAPALMNVRRSASAIRKFAHQIVEKKRLSIARGEKSDLDIMSVAMTSGHFSDSEVVDQMMTFLAAGHETTASALTWAMYVLCEHPKIQTRLREEVRANLPSIRDPASEISALQIDKLPYLNAVCNEVLRLIPTVPMTIRDASVDTTILDQHIPKGTRIFMSPWATNANLELWDDTALEFDPERWMASGRTNTGGAKNNFAMMTFLHGPRSCIGKDFAKSEFLCILAAWIGRFEIRWAEGRSLPMEVEGWVTSSPQHKMPVVFEEIEGW